MGGFGWLPRWRQAALASQILALGGPYRDPGGPCRDPGREKKRAYETMISLKNPLNIFTRKFSLATKVGFRVRALEPMHQDDSRKHIGGS